MKRLRRIRLGCFCIIALISASTLATITRSTAAPISVYPAKAEGFTQSLNGDWSFKYIPSLNAGADAGFNAPSFDVSAWKKIVVPANWEMKGFAEPGYDIKGLKDGLGLYRRTLRVPAAWRGGRRVCLRFEGVAYGFEAWVNGTKIGASGAGAYEPNTFDITDALQTNAKADNVLAVQVTTKPFGYEFDVNDDWALSGIYRDVTLFSVPTTYLQDVSTQTKLAADGSADLSVSVTVNQPGSEVRGKLLAPDGQTVSEFDLPQQPNGHYDTTVHVVNPQLWTAETPALYRLQLTLSAKDQPLQTIGERIGLREISIKDGVFLLNGRPIKLRGVNHHDLDPVDGRAITEAKMRADLDLMKKGNINHVRTSHYPPQPRFLELCDEVGFYVMDEVAIGSRGYKHLKDPAYRNHILARTQATIMRDKNHASVIVWSIGNENPFEKIELDAARYAKELDPTRPVCLPQTPDDFEKSWQKFPEFVDVYSPHYPSNAELREQAKTLKRPTIYSEYVHSWGLGFDRLDDQWEIMQATPQFTGGAIWHFQDQGLLVKSRKPFDSKKPLGAVWLDKNRFYDTHDADGSDGIVYADRTPQTDFWETRKVYSAVQIAERSAAVKPGAQEIALTVENRHDFRALAGMKLAWSLQRNGTDVQKGEILMHAPAHEKETVRIPVNIPADASSDVLALNVRCLDEKALQITERTVRLDLADAQRHTWSATLQIGTAQSITETETEVKITLPRWVLTVARPSGELTIHDRQGRLLMAGIYPHTGRKFSLNSQRIATDSRKAKAVDIWPMAMLTKLDSPVIKVTRQGASVHLVVSGTYPRQDKPEQALVGSYQADISPGGAIAISYDYAATNAQGVLLEAGLSVVLPDSLSEFRWIGQGPYPAYPGKERLDEFGLFHLNREDLHFQGNRRETELALLTNPTGAGVALAMTTPADVAVERNDNQTFLNHNAVISALGNKGWLPETLVDVAKTPHLAGSFTLVPLDDKWPAALTRWFGKPAAARKVFRPFYHSYDQ